MLDTLQLPFQGNLHSGLDDGKNIAKIVVQLIQVNYPRVNKQFLNNFMKRMVVYWYPMSLILRQWSSQDDPHRFEMILQE